MRHPALFSAIATLALLLPETPHANDGVGAIGAGGVVLRNERRIAMKKERLFVSPRQIRVQYEFVNVSQDDVTTEVVFPIPQLDPYDYAFFVGITDFTVSIDGSRIPVEKDVRASYEGKDVTRSLRAAGLDLATWVGETPSDRESSIRRLPLPKLLELRRRGLLNYNKFDRPFGPGGYLELDEPQWSSRISYHWTQRFPAGKVVRVEHEYTPAVGHEQGVQADSVKAACGNPRWAIPYQGYQANLSGATSLVKYTLTTANTWKTPISDFELIVERPEDAVVSFCWDGPVEKVGKTTFRAAVEDFVPKRELTVYFFSLPPAVDGAARGDR
jgi:hypothetical protein